MISNLPNEIIVKILGYVPLACILNVSSVSQSLLLLASSPEIWRSFYKLKWEKKTELLEPENSRENEIKIDDANMCTNTEENSSDWKYLYKERLRSETEKEFQRVSAEALKFQAKVALQLNRKREFDHAIQYLQNKKSKITPPTEPQPTPILHGWHPTPIQRHFNQANTINPPVSAAQKEEIKKKALYAATHGKFLQNCLEDVQKRNAFASQVLERYSEMSHDIEQRKKRLGNELKRLRN